MGGKSSSVIVGYKYSLGLHMALSYPVDAVTKFIVDDRLAWSGSAASGQITVDAPDLFGGTSREGGVAGTVDVLDGNASQTKNSYLVSHLGNIIPAYKGVFSLVLNSFYIGNNPYIKNMAWEVKRTDRQTDFSTQWYIATANINSGDLNAAHIIRECFTNDEWGMGYPTSIINDAAFTAAAATLFSEGFGLSLLWNQQDTIESFVQHILDTIQAVVREDPATGTIGLYLIRDDYTAASLPLLDESNILTVDSFERRAWGETVNEVTVVYNDRASGETGVPVSVQDMGNIQIQNSVITESKDYPGIPNADLALKVAMRDLRVLSSPLSKLEATVNREFWALRRGEVVRVSFAKYGLVEVVYRVMDVDDGDLVDGKIKLTLLEDVWGMPTSTYVTPETSGWVVPNNAPAPVPYQQVVEASYWDVQINISPADIAQFGSDFGFVLAHAVRPTRDAYHYRMLSRNGAAPYEVRSNGSFCPTAELAADLGIAEGGLTDAVVAVVNAVDLTEVEVDTFAYIGDEIVAVKAVDTGASTVTIDRGVLDSVPVAHSAGARIWFTDSNQGIDRTERVDAESVDVKLLPTTGLGTLLEASATPMNLVLDNRYQRPYPPGNLKINGEAYPDSFNGEAVLTWSHRDRTLQVAYLNDQTEGDIGPEPDVVYNLRLYDENDVLVQEQTGLSGTSYSWSTEIADSSVQNLPAPEETSSYLDYGSEVLADSPWGYWRVGETTGATATDSSGNARHGTYNSVTLDQPSLVYNDSDPAITMTIASYINGVAGPVTDNGVQEVLVKPTEPITLPAEQASGFNGVAGQKYVFYPELVTPGSGAGVSVGTNGVVVVAHSSGYLPTLLVYAAALDDGNAHHIAVKWTSRVPSLYIDGVLVRTSPYAAAGPLTISALQSDITYDRFAGDADEFAVYSSLLSDIRILAHSDISLAPETPYRLNGLIRLELEAYNTVETLLSSKKHDVAYRRAGYGYNYGYFYGGE